MYIYTYTLYIYTLCRVYHLVQHGEIRRISTLSFFFVALRSLLKHLKISTIKIYLSSIQLVFKYLHFTRTLLLTQTSFQFIFTQRNRELYLEKTHSKDARCCFPCVCAYASGMYKVLYALVHRWLGSFTMNTSKRSNGLHFLCTYAYLLPIN